jgi:hypothetical protein
MTNEVNSMNELNGRIVDPRLVRRFRKLEELRQSRGGLLMVTDILMAFTVPAPKALGGEDTAESGDNRGRVTPSILWMDGGA